ncbi:conjugal transfer protein TraW [Klebsiella pneumoniae]|uniref:conjugal transfer protein TraW n=1 Tax=Klebsiella pneumoniae TaxID=573 RepID=UPI001D0EB561|nr:conjugal transfer protein TraW [Klebsiella pneumoniae]
MIKIGKAKRSVMAVSILAFSVQSAFAYTVNVNSSIPISTQVMPALSTANGLLGNIQATLINIGTAISQQGDRQAALMQQVAETNRQFEVEQKRNDRLLQAQDKYRVPDDICAQSIGGGAAGVSSAAAGGQRTLGSASSAKDVKGGARRIRKKSYAKVFRASVRAETSRLPVCGSAARRNRRLG